MTLLGRTGIVGGGPENFYDPAKWVERIKHGGTENQLEIGADYVKVHAKMPVDPEWSASIYGVSFVSSSPQSWTRNRRLKFKMETSMQGTSGYCFAVGIGGAYPDPSMTGEQWGSFVGVDQMQIDSPENHDDWCCVMGGMSDLGLLGQFKGYFGTDGNLVITNRFEVRYFYNNGSPYAEFYQEIDGEMVLRFSWVPDELAPEFEPRDDEPWPNRKQDCIGILLIALDADCYIKVSEIEYDGNY
jgi:hypothetical protein